MHTGALRLLVTSLLILVASSLGGAAEGPKDIVLGDCLILGPVGRYGRAPLHRDALEAQIVAGKWAAPKAGDKVAVPGGTEQTWQEAKAGADGSINNAALAGGYLYWRVTLDAPCVMLLDAAGHSSVEVNDEPRTGDPYENGMARLPVALKQGANDLLFHCGRGHLRARLTPPPAPAFLDPRDTTLPDFRTGEEGGTPWGALLVVNADTKPLAGVSLRATTGGGDPVTTGPITPLPPCSIRKVGFRVRTAGTADGDSVPITVELVGDDKALDSKNVAIRLRKPDQSYKHTFVSDIDGSVQYYAVQPARPPKDKDAPPPALVLTLHGASVEAIGQADAYAGKEWCHIVAPTNRRPYGFDWEDWGRLDALEVLDLAKKDLHTDPLRTYLTGHSMGGHGAWHVGATVPDRWAAIAPSAGWISFATYGGGRAPDNPTPMQAMVQRAAAPSDTASLARNCAAYGVYILHGDADDNVPVEQAREMRRLLGAFHPDFSYYERPGAGHWWGNACVDWPPLFDFLQRHTLTPIEKVRQVDFITAAPSVSPTVNWARIDAQLHPFQYSAVHLHCDPDKRIFSGKTDNVARLALDLAPLKPGDPVQVELDGQKVENIAWPEKGPRLWLRREDGKWSVSQAPSPAVKNADRSGPFKDAFRNGVVFVYGTKGTAEENAWALAKARFDAETFWYRGNASVDVIPDTAFDANKERDHNVVLYGASDGNAACKELLGDSPVQVRRGVVQVGDRKEEGDSLACVFVRPRQGSDRALVGVVAGSGSAGMRLTDHLVYFLSGAEYPDCLVFGPEVLAHAAEGVRAAGFFGPDWGVQSGEFEWGDKMRGE
jgi:pimeloyl-ACP methyl ester carboxylesterase